METASKRLAIWAKSTGLLGIGLCTLCCALPIMGMVGSAGILATVELYAEKIGLVLIILSAASFAIWQYKKRQAPSLCDRL